MNFTAIKTAATLTTLFSLPALAQQPIGFERWNPLPSSFVEFGRTCHDLQADYNHPTGFSSGNRGSGAIPAPGGVQTTSEDNVEESKKFRLSDIEVRTDSETGENVLDVVVVTNTGWFRRKSWLVCGLSELNVHQWASIQHLTILDVERYVRNDEYRWAAIIQEDPFGVETWFLTGSTEDSINFQASIDRDLEGWRVVDVEPVDHDDDHCQSNDGKEACGGETTYAAILVKNAGANQVDWSFKDGYTSDNLVPEGFQLVDRERTGAQNWPAGWKEARLSVRVDNEDFTTENLTQDNVHWFNYGSNGIIIDLEWDHMGVYGSGLYDWYIVMAQNW